MPRPIESLRHSSAEMTKALHCAIQAAVAQGNLLCNMSDRQTYSNVSALHDIGGIPSDSKGLSFRLDQLKLCEQEGYEAHTEYSLPCDTHKVFA